MTHPTDTLSDKEKETLRLLVRGYDSKSIARHFDLSVHTVNERLRNARQKMAVSSSREAARLLHESEGAGGSDTPENLGDTKIGDAPSAAAAITQATPPSGHGRRMSLPMLIGVIAVMSIFLSLIALAAASPDAGQAPEPTISAPAQDTEVVQAARQWLALVDASDWAGSYAATGQSFKDLNSLEVWTKVAGETQPQFGQVQSRAVAEVQVKSDGTGRTLMSEEYVPAPPMGYQMVKFQTNFAAKPDAVETLTLVEEGGTWKVVGYIIE
jgi:DNA-binding CsgD family transcriptional regulator